jgi:Transcriptional regulators
MTTDNRVVPILEALWLAKKATECMPELPAGLKPSHIRVLDAIYRQRQRTGCVRVMDVSTAMHITKPSITKLLNELVELAAVRKSMADADKRIVLVELTAFGEQCVQSYVVEYHAMLAQYFAKLAPDKYRTMIEAIEYIYQSMKEVSQKNAEF